MNTLQLKRTLTPMLLVSLFVLCGCAHEYLIKLKNGDQIVSLTKPKLQGAGYHFTGTSGDQHVIPQSRVAKIQTISIVKEQEQPSASAKPTTPKKRKHWYFLWLA